MQVKCETMSNCKLETKKNMGKCTGAFRWRMSSYKDDKVKLTDESLTESEIGDCYENTLLAAQTCAIDAKKALESVGEYNAPSDEEIKAFKDEVRKARRAKKMRNRRNKMRRNNRGRNGRNGRNNRGRNNGGRNNWNRNMDNWGNNGNSWNNNWNNNGNGQGWNNDWRNQGNFP